MPQVIFGLAILDPQSSPDRPRHGMLIPNVEQFVPHLYLFVLHHFLEQLLLVYNLSSHNSFISDNDMSMIQTHMGIIFKGTSSTDLFSIIRVH